jgi:glucose-6-phosphate 1-dehydrogenase
MNHTQKQPDNVQMVLFGAGGDLSSRLILPALYNLFLDKKLPANFQLIGIDRHDYSNTSLAAHFHDGVMQFSRQGIVDEQHWQQFSTHLSYHRGDLGDASLYHELTTLLSQQEQAWGGKSEHLFYLAIPPAIFAPVAKGLGEAGLARNRDNARIVVEKPLGYDLDSFREINQVIRHVFKESQIYRIDHFLGKETVQNILALRFANPLFEPIWNRRYVDHVAITVSETLGVELRGKFYEHAGALRDMIQNHLLQLVCLVAMEPPVAYDADDIRSKKLDVLRALRPIQPEDVAAVAARGQYANGWLNGEHVSAYRDEPDVSKHSNVETFAALKLYIDNWRWQEVPFFLRTGKRMAADVSEISIRFQDVPHHAFPATVGLNATPARLVIQLHPEQGIVIKFMAKEPGAQWRLSPADMRFSYADAFQTTLPDAYETLLLDVMLGDATLFMHADQVEAAWKFLMPILDVWGSTPATDFPNYLAGSWGPETAETLIAADGKSWMTPTLPEVKLKN